MISLLAFPGIILMASKTIAGSGTLKKGEFIVRRSELARFGLIFGVVFLLVAAYFYYRYGRVVNFKVMVLLGISGIFFFLGLFNPYVLFHPYRWWMAFAHKLGTINTKIILTLFFFLVLTPVYFVIRRVREDPLFLKKPDKDSYWLEREKKEFDELDYSRPF